MVKQGRLITSNIHITGGEKPLKKKKYHHSKKDNWREKYHTVDFA